LGLGLGQVLGLGLASMSVFFIHTNIALDRPTHVKFH